jgi:hypothetical protein
MKLLQASNGSPSLHIYQYDRSLCQMSRDMLPYSRRKIAKVFGRLDSM